LREAVEDKKSETLTSNSRYLKISYYEWGVKAWVRAQIREGASGSAVVRDCGKQAFRQKACVPEVFCTFSGPPELDADGSCVFP
jgi:hypothetical protein